MKAARTRHGASFFDRVDEIGTDRSDSAPATTGAPPAADPAEHAALPQKKPRKPDRRRALTRRAIIDAASELFADRGVDVTTIDDIAAAAQLSAGTLYFHFGNKENVVLALVSTVLEAESGYLAVADGSGTALERLLEAGDSYFRFALEQPLAFDFIAAGLPELPDDAPGDAVAARRHVASRVGAFAAAVATDLQQSMADRETDELPVAEALALVWGTWNGIAGLIRRGDEFAISAEFGERVVARGRLILLRGLVRERPTA